MEMKPLQCIRNARGDRIKYDPEWSPTKPYCTYYARHSTMGGTSAELQFATLPEAKRYLGGGEWSEPY